MIKHLSVRAAQLLMLSFFVTSLALAQAEPDFSAAREAAVQMIPKLEAGTWQSSGTALRTSSQLATSQDKADKELAEKLMDLSVTAMMKGLQNLPPPPEQERLRRKAYTLIGSLLNHSNKACVQHARTLVDAWEKALPDDLSARLLRLRLHVLDKNRAEQIKLSAALLEEEDLDSVNRNYARDVYVCALLHGRQPSADDLQSAETLLNQWLQEQPGHVRARVLTLDLHHARQDWPAQYALASELLADEKLDARDRKWVHQQRLEGALNTGRTQELNEQDWNFMLEQITGGKGLKQFIDKHGQLLLGIAFGIGWLWLLIVAWITRSLRAKPPGFWMVTLWSTVILYASSVILASLALCITFSLLGIVFLIFAITGQKAPLNYLVPPQAATESGRASWGIVVRLCITALVFVHLFTMGYERAFERVMGRPLETQFVAKLLRTDTVPKLIGMVLAGGIFVPFLEEVIFRGMLQDWVGRRLPAGWCVLIVSTLFGLVHGLEMALPIAFIGVLLSLLRLHYRSLWPCIILHALNNSVMIVLLYFFPEEIL